MNKKTKEKFLKRLKEVLKEEIIKIENSKLKSTLFVMYICYMFLVLIFNPYNLLLILVVYVILFAVIINITARVMYKDFFKSNYKRVYKKSFWDTFYDTGSLGEYFTFNKLEKIDKNNILVNIYIPKNNKENEFSEIDIIMINKTGIYVFESKNISGLIFGSQKDKYWTIVLGKKCRFKTNNPIIQNSYHIKYLKEFLKEENLDYSYFKSYIVLSERCEIKKMNIYSKNLKILKRNNLEEIIEDDIKNSKEILTEEKINQIYDKLIKCGINDERKKEEHIQNIKEKYIIEH